MKYQPTDILLIFLGSVLAFLATLLVETIKNQRERNEKGGNLYLLIRQEFYSVKKLLDRLKNVLELKNYYDYGTLNQLADSINTLKSYKRDVVYLPNIYVQEQYIDLVSDFSTLYSNARILQDIYYAEESKLEKGEKSIFPDKKELIQHFNNLKIQYSIEFIEISRRINELLASISKRND